MTKAMTLLEMLDVVRTFVQQPATQNVWVTAEVQDVQVRGGHCYMEMLQKDDAGRQQARVRGCIWASNYARIARSFYNATGQQFASGLKVMVRVSASFHPVFGISLVINEVNPEFTMGDLLRRRNEILRRLQAEGVLEMNRQLRWPLVPQRIAVVSSRQAAGYQDFCKEIGKSPYDFRVTLFDAFMQGAAAEDSIIAALGEIAEQCDRFDAVVLIRGGGSASDLNCFNAYRLCAHVAQFPLPVLTGIGHDKDTSVADMVAYTALKTPTAVAGWLVERMARVEGWLDTAALALHDAAATLSRSHLLRLERLQSDLKGLCEALSIRKRAELDTLASRLGDACERLFDRERGRLESAALLVESRSPHHILRLGFSIVRAGERALASAKGVRPGDSVTIELADGTLRATVETTDE